MEDLNSYTEAYTKSFEFYDENIWYLTRYAELMCRTIRENDLSRIISLGIGHEVVSQRMAKEWEHGLKKHIIIDGSDELIDKFQKSYPKSKSEVILSYFENLETEETFDAIEMGFVLEHVDNPKEILDKYRNLLCKDGRLFIAVPNARSLHRLIGHEAGMLKDMYQLSKADLELGHKRYFDLETIVDLVQSANYEVVKTVGLMLKPVTGAQIKQLEWGDKVIGALMGIGEDYPEIANCIYLEARKV